MGSSKAPSFDDDDDDEPTAVRSRGSQTGGHVRWRPRPPRSGEAVRWECVDGRWVSISLGVGVNAGNAVVADSEGRSEAVATYEEALSLAKSWRT